MNREDILDYHTIFRVDKDAAIFSVSTVQTFATCPVKWDYRYNKKLNVLFPTDAQSEGTAWHEVAAGQRPTMPHDPVWLRGAFDEWQEEKKAWDITVLETEVPLETFSSPGITLIGRPDAIVRWNGQIWHLQHKSVRASMPVALYLEQLRRSWHEAAYRQMISERYPNEPYGGSFLVLARKLKNPPFLVVTPVLVTEKDAAGALTELRHYGVIMNHVSQTNMLAHPPNRNSCYGAFGNSKCVYFDACYNGTTEGLVHDDPYKTYDGFTPAS
jgi:hypothetical protein